MMMLAHIAISTLLLSGALAFGLELRLSRL